MIADNVQPKTPKSGIGLYVSVGRKRKVLINPRGELTPAGKYYYEKTNQDPPKSFDFAQIPQRKGRSLTINLLDGTKKIVSRFDNIAKEFKLTAIGKKFYANKKDRFTVLFPVFVDITRINGSIFSREDYMASTTVDIGEIEVSAAISDQEQINKVKQIAQDWIHQQPLIYGQRILLPGYETHRYDPSRELQFNKLSFNIAGEAESIMHRPLTTASPMMFNFNGVCSEAAENTDDQCVIYQLSKNIKIQGKSSFSTEQLARDLIQISEDLYEDDEEMLNQPGFTTTVIKKFCEEYNIPIHIKWGENKIDSFTPYNSIYDDLCVIIWGNHLYTVSDPDACNQIKKETITNAKQQPFVLDRIIKSNNKSVDFSEWELFSELMPGHWYTRDINRIRSKLHENYISPTVYKSGLNKIKTLTYNDCIIHNLPQEAEVCAKFLQHMTKIRPHNIQYRSESFAGFGSLVFASLCQVDPRTAPTLLERQAAIAKSKGKCEMCGDPIEEGVMDHHVPRSAFGKDSLGNYKYLCIFCHKIKTTEDVNNKINLEDVNPYCSRFNEHTWKGFVLSRKPTQIVADLHMPGKGPLVECDIKSCRYSAIVECNNQPIPIFSPMDEFEKVDGFELSDYMFVEIPECRIKSMIKTYAYDGPRWYSKAEIQFMLETGLCIWDDFKLKFQATAHRNPKDLASKLKFMKDIWEDVGNTHTGENWSGERKKNTKTLLSKTALLALIGSWGRIKNERFNTITTDCPDDCPFDGEITKSLAPGSKVFYDITWRQEVLSYASYLPLNLIGRALERLNIARAIMICLKYQRIERLIGIQVDCIVFQPPKSAWEQNVKELREMTYRNLHSATRKPLSFKGPIQDPIQSKEIVYKVNEIQEAPKFGGVLKREVCEMPEVEKLEWTVHIEPKTGEDTFSEIIYDHILKGESCMVNGPPGTGKSFILKMIANRLKDSGYDVKVIAPTNAAARLIEGQTCHNFITKIANSKDPFQGIILIDEVSMLSLALVAILDQLRAGKCRIITFGDWEQLPPVSNCWRGNEVDPLILKDSKLLKRWSHQTLFQLTRCRRSDQSHFDFYTSLPQNLDEAKRLTIKKYRKRSHSDLHLVISHRHRISLNTTEQDKFCQGKPSVLIPAQDCEYEYNCIIGTPLVGSCTNKKFLNGAFYEIIEINPLRVKDTLTEEIIECTPEVLSKHTCLAHAVVYNRAQGLTIKDKTICLHDLFSKHFKRNHLYVGLSRVTNGNNIRVR